MMMAVDPASPAPAMQIVSMLNPDIAAPKIAVMAPVTTVSVGRQRRNRQQNGTGERPAYRVGQLHWRSLHIGIFLHASRK